MSIRVTSWVWDGSAATGADRLVLLAIADFANDTGRDAYPSSATLAARTKMDKRTVQRSVRALVALGELKVAENAGPRGTNRYQVMVPRGWRTATPSGNTPPGDTPSPPAHDHPKGRQPATEGGDTPPGAASDPSGGGETPPEPSLNHPLVTTTAVASRNAPPGFAARVLRAYIAACPEHPAEKLQTRVARQAAELLAEGHDADRIVAAAEGAGRGGWTDLAVQMQRNAASARPAPGTRPSTSDQRALAAREAGREVALHLAALPEPERRALR